MSAVSVAVPISNIDENINSNTIINNNLEQVGNSFHVSDVTEETNPIQCYVNQDNSISFINNGHTFSNENGEMFYACITSGVDNNQQDQILQLIPQNQLSNFIVSDKEFSSLNFINESNLLNCNQFFSNNISDNSLKLSATIKKQHCVVCDLDFPSKRAYLKHMTIHDNDREFKCSCCKLSYNHEINLLVHVAIIHPDQCSVDNSTDLNYRCLVCSLTFSRKKALQGHCLIHQVDEELFCERCSASFNSKVILDKHIADHSNETDEQVQASVLHCKLCKETFNNIGHVKRHYKLCHQKVETWTEDSSENKKCEVEPECDQNFDPSNKRRSSKIASQTIKLYAQGKLKLRDPSNETGENKKRGRPRKIQGVSKHSSKNDVTCSTCQRTFKTPILLRRHEVTHTGIKEFECPICKKKFTQKSSVKIHMVVHDEVKAFKCQLCHKAFTYEHNMLTHVRAVHKFEGDDKNVSTNQKIIQNENLYICNNERSIMQQRQPLECYLNQEHDVTQSYITYENNINENYSVLPSVDCDQHNVSDSLAQGDGEECQYLWQENQQVGNTEAVTSSYTRRRLKRNAYIPSTQNFTKIDWDKSQAMTENRGILLSEEVEKVDKETGQVQVHEVIRDQITGFKRFRCRFCKKLYRKSADLSRHVRIHTQQRPFKCYLCHKSFRLKSVLKNHFKSHWKLKEFSCELCLKSFNLKQTLQVHLRLHNTEEMKYSCEICQKKFNTSFHYKYHNRTQHKEPTECSYMNSIEMLPTRLEPLVLDANAAQHRNIDRPFKCNQCHKSYKVKKYLKDHMKDHMQMHCRKVCMYCDKSFLTVRSLQQHTRTQHINRRAFMCSKCPASFILKASLNRHGIVHSTTKPFACPLCFRRFKAKMYCDRHISLQKCIKRNSELSQQKQFTKKVDKIGPNIESEILNTEGTTGPYCNFRLVDLDMNTSQASNILVTNYVNDFSDKFMVVSLDGTKNREQHQSDQTTYYMEDRNTGDNLLGMLDNQIAVNPIEIGTMYNYVNSIPGQLMDNNRSRNMMTYQQQSQQQLPQSDNVYYYQTISNIEEPIQKGSLADKFPILKATLFSEDENTVRNNKPKQAVVERATNTVTYSQDSHLLDQSVIDLNPSPGKLLHGCANCIEQFQDSETLIRHVKQSHKIAKDFQCNVCHKAFSVQLSLWAHSKIHDTVHIESSNDDFLLCIACNQRFISVPSLSRHVRMQHNDKLNLYRCLHCDLTYKTTRELDSHIKQLNSDYDAIIINSHLVNNPNKPDSYQRNLKDASFCKDYQIELETSEIDQIASLDASKASKLSMQELIKAAKEKRAPQKPTRDPTPDIGKLDPLLSYPYSCSVCHKGFNRASNLQQHLSVHTKMTPYQCQKCNRKFRHRCSLKTHENTKHSVLMKLLRCHLCLRLLRSQVALRNHMKIHLKSYSFQCDICFENFPTSQEQIRHCKLKLCKPATETEDRVEETPLKVVKCVTCSVAFTSISDYEMHQCIKQKRSPHQCVLCQNIFTTSAELCKHICDAHKQQTRYKCSLCDLLFVQESLLIRHQKNVHKISK